MKLFLAAVAMIAMLGFVTSASAKDAKPHKGRFVEVDGDTLTWKGGVKGTGKDHTAKVDSSTKVTLDGKDAKLSDLKEGVYIEVTMEKDMALTVTALTNPPTPKNPPATKPSAAS